MGHGCPLLVHESKKAPWSGKKVRYPPDPTQGLMPETVGDMLVFRRVKVLNHVKPFSNPSNFFGYPCYIKFQVGSPPKKNHGA